MFEDLSFGEPQRIAPKKMERRAQELPGPIARAYDDTPMGEAAIFPVSLPAAADVKKIGDRLVGLLKRYAKAIGTVAFKASYEVATEGGLLLYWQKKSARITMGNILGGESALAHLAGEGDGFPLQLQKASKKGGR